MELIVKKTGEDTGNCREYFQTIDTKRRICLVHDICWGVKTDKWYTCTKDGEPDCSVRQDVKITIMEG